MTLGVYTGAGAGITKLLWHMEGNSNDSSGNGNNGTDTSITYALANGKFSQGAQMNNVNDQIVKATNLGIAGNGEITISLWTKLNTEIASGIYQFTIFRSTTGADRYFGWYYEYNAGTRRLRLDGSGTSAYGNIDLGTIAKYNVIVTRASGASPVMNLYLNGSLFITGNAGAGAAGANDFRIGNATASPIADFDEVIVENVAWSASQARKYYTWAMGRYASCRL